MQLPRIRPIFKSNWMGSLIVSLFVLRDGQGRQLGWTALLSMPWLGPAPHSPAGAGSIAAECHLLGAAERHQKSAPCIFLYWKVIFMRVNNSSSGLHAFCSFTPPPDRCDMQSRAKKKKLNPKSEPDAQVTDNRLASPLNSDMRPECFIAAHANLLPPEQKF